MSRLTRWLRDVGATLRTRLAGRADPWRRRRRRLGPHHFGLGSTHPFAWYLAGESAVPVASIDDVCAWLAGCAYGCDPELFHEVDHWQHPAAFEQVRQGDCEDHALWAWRKLVELGLDAELVSGRWTQPGAPPDEHVWVRYRQDGRDYILESVARPRERMIRPLDEVREEYMPRLGVDHTLTSYVYAGARVALF